MKNAIRLVLALALVTVLSTSLTGLASAAPPENHGSGKDRQGFCEVPPGSGQYEPCLSGTNGTEPSQSHGNFLYGTPGEDRRAYPEPGEGPGCTAASALNSNPSQAAGDNVGYPNEHAADRAQGGPFGRDCG